MLGFSPANAKTTALYSVEGIAEYLEGNRKVYSLDLSSGISCPGAKDCKAYAIESTPGKWTIQDGPDCRFRCFSASQEVTFPATRIARRRNFDQLRETRGVRNILSLLVDSLPGNAGVIRYHVAGDFFKYEYLQAAYRLASSYPTILFYAYTKSLHHLWRLTQEFEVGELSQGVILPNFLITASRGGRYDTLVPQLDVRESIVCFSEGEAKRLGLKIDHTDEHAATKGGSFGLLLHGIQPKGTEAASALSKLKGKGTYSRK